MTAELEKEYKRKATREREEATDLKIGASQPSIRVCEPDSVNFCSSQHIHVGLIPKDRKEVVLNLIFVLFLLKLDVVFLFD